MGEEEEGEEAGLLVRFDLLREACVDGGVRRRPRLGHGHGAGRLGFLQRVEKEGEEEQHVEGGLFTLHGGGQGARRSAGMTRRRGGHGDSGFPVATGKGDGVFPKNPLALLPPFSKINPAVLWQLFQALNYF